MFRTNRTLPTRRAAARPLAAIFLAAAISACSHHAPPQLAAAPAPPPAPKHTTAWEDSVVLAKMAADRQADEAAKAAAAKAAAEARDALGKLAFFDFDRAELSDQDKATLDAKIPILQQNPGVQIQISGNCDDRGSDEYNLALGQRRAAAAKRYLVDRGIDQNRVQIISYGLERPLQKGETEQAWAMNRNDQFVIIAGDIKAQNGHD